MTTAERLNLALARSPVRSIRALHGELERQGFEATYSTVHRYFAGAVEPPRAFLARAATVLTVREAWLVLEQGEMTEEEERSQGFKRLGEQQNSPRSQRESYLRDEEPEGDSRSDWRVEAVMTLDDLFERRRSRPVAGRGFKVRIPDPWPFETEQGRRLLLRQAMYALRMAEAGFDLQPTAQLDEFDGSTLREGLIDPRSSPRAYAIWAWQELSNFARCIRGLAIESE